MKRFFLAQDAVQVADPQAQPTMTRLIEQVPVEALLDVPLAPLTELAAHEEQLFARLGVHPAEQEPQVGELLPLVARHLGDERTLSMHDLVVRKREHEVLAERVEHPERQVLMMELAVHRLALEVIERVVHPAHVPLHAESKAADIRGPRHQRPRGRLFGDRLHVGKVAVHALVEEAQELDRVEVLPPAEAVRDPLAVLPAVIQVEHRGDRVDAQPIRVVAVEPVERAAEQKAADLVAPVVEDRASPVGVHAEAWIGMLEQVRSVEVLEAELVGRKMRRHPVEDHADAVLVQVVDQEHEVLRRAITAGRREVAGDLVAP